MSTIGEKLSTGKKISTLAKAESLVQKAKTILAQSGSMTKMLKGTVQESLEGLHDMIIKLNDKYLDMKYWRENEAAQREADMGVLRAEHSAQLVELLGKWEVVSKNICTQLDSGPRLDPVRTDLVHETGILSRMLSEFGKRCDGIQAELDRIKSGVEACRNTTIDEAQDLRNRIAGDRDFGIPEKQDEAGIGKLSEQLLYVECELRAIKEAVGDKSAPDGDGGTELVRKMDQIYRKVNEVTEQTADSAGVIVGLQRHMLGELEHIREREEKIARGVVEIKMKQTSNTGNEKGTNNTYDPQLSAAIAKVHNEVVDLKAKLTAPTYAEVVAKRVVDECAQLSKPPKRVHSIIVGSTDPQDTAGIVEQKIRSSLEARKNGLRLQGVRKLKGSKVLLTCESPEELEKVELRIRGCEELLAEEAKGKDPLVILKNLLSCNTEADIVASLGGQNAELWADLEEGSFRVSERYRRRARNANESMVILQVSPEVWMRLNSAGKVHIDMQLVNVRDQSPLVQCTRCLGFGHGRRLCKEEVDSCSHCGGSHMRTNCPDYEAGAIPNCRNCRVVAGGREAGHNALSRDCPTRKKWDALARESYNYCG